MHSVCRTESLFGGNFTPNRLLRLRLKHDCCISDDHYICLLLDSSDRHIYKPLFSTAMLIGIGTWCLDQGVRVIVIAYSVVFKFVSNELKIWSCFSGPIFLHWTPFFLYWSDCWLYWSVPPLSWPVFFTLLESFYLSCRWRGVSHCTDTSQLWKESFFLNSTWALIC